MRYDALTLKQLRALETVCDKGTITAAADTLSLTPPAVHGQLKSLEESCGVALVRRDAGGRFVPTEEGAVLLAGHERARAALTRAMREIEALRRGVAGTVVLGVVSTGKYFAPRIVAGLRKSLPGVDVQLVIGNRTQIIEGLENESIDVAVMGRPPRQPANLAEAIGVHPHVMICAPGHRLAEGKVSVGALLDEHFLLREEGSGTRILSVRYLDQMADGRPYAFTEMGSNETIKQSVIAGLGIALISAHTVIDELASGRLALVRAPGLPIPRQWYLLHRADHDLTPAMRNVHDEILRNAAHMLRSEEVEQVVGRM
ncbi:LysR family transcriptional regulator [Aliigemmobacter aestuarii]|uniref:HTH-type transcriptional regulator CbbR n=1 Tax=Aliigemmobacter aestuarii TaxID=1445661 RepID=A0A4S3MM19_9RHOB|nr:LysR family transcriptional regulator [Gemmobacter aestuarii]THD81350.1 LysR family transcriptional regulator [Gemmobacter aestuarii]